MVSEPGSADADLIVVGAGINGACIARDAARRGLSVTLVEADDIASGTSGWSSRLIHGGLRYLEHGDLRLVRESLRERETLLAIAPHLVRPLPLLIPLVRGQRPKWMIRAGMIAYDLLSWRKSLPRHRMLSAREAVARVPALARQDGLRGAAGYHDAQVAWAERLVVENVLDAAAHGARVLTGTPVRAPMVEGGRLAGVRLEDGRALRAAAVVNAAGPWVDAVLGSDRAPLIGGTRGAHLVLDPPNPMPGPALYVQARADGRPVFMIPWGGQLLVGTTDLRHRGDPRRVEVTPQERSYLHDEVAALWPELGGADRVRHVHAGVRPLPAVAPDAPESAIPRGHVVHAHGGELDGLFSVVGGKLTTCRQLAEDAVDAVARRLGVGARHCTTAVSPLPGACAQGLEEARARLAEARLVGAAGERLLGVYGAAAARIATRVQAGAAAREVLCPLAGGVMAEFEHALEHEWCRGLSDFLHRRAMVGLGADFGLAAARRVLAWAHRHRGWDRGRCDDEWAAYLELARLRQARALAGVSGQWRP